MSDDQHDTEPLPEPEEWSPKDAPLDMPRQSLQVTSRRVGILALIRAVRPRQSA